MIAKDVIIVGAAHTEGSRPESRRNEKGYVRGFDVRTGKRLWIFHTIPEPGEFGSDTWEQDSRVVHRQHRRVGADQRGRGARLVYLPVEMPTGDYYGGHRPGDGLFGESLVAVDLKTGKRKWHYQFVQHGIWDWDLPCAPILADLDDRRPNAVKVVAQPTKQAWLYVFDRVTGEPIWPIEERPVEQSDVPMEKTSPTQPFVTKPPAYDRQGVSIDDLIDFTPELRAEAVKLASRYKIGPIFTPPVVSKWDGPLAHADAAGRDRRRELAGRLVRSGDRHPSTSSRTRRSSALGLRAGLGASECKPSGHGATSADRPPIPAEPPKAPAVSDSPCRVCR